VHTARRIVPAIMVIGLLLAAATPMSLAQEGDSAPNLPAFDHVAGGNVTPPGNTGHVPTPDTAAALAGGYERPNSTDQRDLYVDWGRKDWAFTKPEDLADLGDPITPAGRDDVVIHVDEWGVPRIFGETDEATQFGVGYAMASQRMFQADIFRHLARGEMAAFLGGQEWFDYDRAWRLEFYTDEELLAMLEANYTEEEQDLLQAYLDGINAYIEDALADPRLLPAEYGVLGIVPGPWELPHALAVFVLQARDSVEGFGEELANAVMLAELQANLGADDGRRAFEDLRFVRDPAAVTTTPVDDDDFTYPGGGFEGLDAPGIVLPDDPDDAAAVAQHDVILQAALDRVGLGRSQASNAITVSGELTSTGQPIQLGGPQLQYLVPGIFWEFEAHSPRQHVRGIGFAGTAGVALIGKTPTHAWSISYGYTDQVDVFLVPLDPAQPDTHYLRDGQSHELETYTSTVTCKADQVGFLTSPDAEKACDGSLVNQDDVVVQRVPEYGAVIGRVTVDDAPHAVVKVRAHWMREVANGRPFLTFNQPGDVEQFRAAQQDFNISLNLHYVDDQGTFGYWHVARPPIRAQGTDVRLPTIGDGTHDWQGFIALEDVPHAINSSQGFTVNWNNQISAAWHNGDSNEWADIQRVDVLQRGMEALATRGDITPEDIWDLNRRASHADVRFEDVGGLVIDLLESQALSATAQAALTALAGWDGQRTSSDVDGTLRYDAAATEIWDRFFATFQRQTFEPALGGLYDDLFVDLDADFYYLAMPVTVRVLKGAEAPLPAQFDWLGGTSLAAAAAAAFEQAVDDLATEFDSDDPATWRGAAVLTTYQSLGLLSVEPHAFMNRGTYNHLAVIDAPMPDMEPAPGTDEQDPPLPTTGGGWALLALAAIAAAAAMRDTVRRRTAHQ
jgi:penicillin G amidase